VKWFRFNRKLLWVALPAVAWAYLGLFAALAQMGPGDKPPLGLRLRLPPGSIELRGRLVEVRETPGQLHIALEGRPDAPQQALDTEGQPLAVLPAGLDLQFLTHEQAAGRELTVQTIGGQTAPFELRGPGHRQVIECQEYIIGLGPRGVALFPNDGQSLGRLERLLRPHNSDGQPGPRPDRQRRQRPRDRFRDWLGLPQPGGQDGRDNQRGQRRRLRQQRQEQNGQPGSDAGSAGTPGADPDQPPTGPPPSGPPPGGQPQPPPGSPPPGNDQSRQ